MSKWLYAIFAMFLSYLTLFAVVGDSPGDEATPHLAVVFGIAAFSAARAAYRRFRGVPIPTEVYRTQRWVLLGGAVLLGFMALLAATGQMLGNPDRTMAALFASGACICGSFAYHRFRSVR